MITRSVFAVLVVELGLITPPVGMNLFVLKATIPDIPMATLWRGVLPFVVADMVRIGLLVAFPILALWLPQAAF